MAVSLETNIKCATALLQLDHIRGVRMIFEAQRINVKFRAQICDIFFWVMFSRTTKLHNMVGTNYWHLFEKMVLCNLKGMCQNLIANSCCYSKYEKLFKGPANFLKIFSTTDYCGFHYI